MSKELELLTLIKELNTIDSLPKEQQNQVYHRALTNKKHFSTIKEIISFLKSSRQNI